MLSVQKMWSDDGPHACASLPSIANPATLDVPNTDKFLPFLLVPLVQCCRVERIMLWEITKILAAGRKDFRTKVVDK